MAEINPELRAAIDVAKERVKVESYFSKAQKASVQGRTQGLWAGSLLGLLSGGMIGGALSLGLMIFGAPLAIPAAVINLAGVPLILGVAGIGAGMGGAGGMLIGAPAGANSGIMAEKERREKAEKLEQEILASPEKQREVIEAYRKDPVVEKDTTVKETLTSYKDKGKAWDKLVDFKTMGFASAICAAFSALICVGAFMISGGAPLVLYGVSVGSAAAAAAIGGVLGASTGALFGLNFPIFFSSLCEKAGDLLSGKMVRGKTGIAPVKSAEQQQQEAVENRIASEAAPQMTVTRGGKAAAMIPENSIAVPAAAERVAQLQPQLGA